MGYESLMVGLFNIWRGRTKDYPARGKINEICVGFSRDGFHWDRPDRTIHIKAERKDVWDRGYVQSLSNICCIQGDKLWIYYTGFQGDTSRTKNNWMQNGMYDKGATGVAFLRRDGLRPWTAKIKPARF